MQALNTQTNGDPGHEGTRALRGALAALDPDSVLTTHELDAVAAVAVGALDSAIQAGRQRRFFRHLRGADQPFDPRRDDWTSYELIEGEMLDGRVVRLPEPGAFHGTRLFVRRDNGAVVALHATANRGHTVLEQRLRNVAVGDRVSITYLGKRATVDGEREYRNYTVSVDG